LDTVKARQPYVQQYEIVALLPQTGETVFAAFDSVHLVAFILENVRERAPDPCFVIDDEY
jgi:hypothetical protein